MKTNIFLKDKASNDFKTNPNAAAEELEFKSQQLHASSETHSRLEVELQKRRLDLKKIDNLEEKISVEMDQLKEKIRLYESELHKFILVDEMKHEKEKQIQELFAKRDQLETKAIQSRQICDHLRYTKLEARKQLLLADETHTNLEANEVKIKQFEQNIHHLKTFIEQREVESDIHPILKRCMQFTNEVNQFVQKQVSLVGLRGY